MRGLFFLLLVLSCVGLFSLWQDNVREQGALQARLRANSIAMSDMLEQQRTLASALCVRDARYAAIRQERETVDKKIQEAVRHDTNTKSWADSPVPAVFDGVF